MHARYACVSTAIKSAGPLCAVDINVHDDSEACRPWLEARGTEADAPLSGAGEEDGSGNAAGEDITEV